MFDHYKAGDTVSIPLYPIGRHEGIVAGNGYIIARSRRFGGVHMVPPSVFAGGRLRDHHSYIGRLDREETLRRAQARIGERGYDVLTNNCIHFVNEVNGLARETRMGRAMTTSPFLSDMLMDFKRLRF